MKSQNNFKKLPSLGALNIPAPDEVPYSPGYKRYLGKRVDLQQTYTLLIFFRKTPRLLSIDTKTNGEDMKEGVEKIEGTLTNSKPKEKVNKK